MNTTICTACGGPIEEPDGIPWCKKCGLERYEDAMRVAELAHAVATRRRPDPSDLTQKLWHIAYKPQWRLVYPRKLAFRGFGLASLAIIAYWLGKQMGLWG